MLTVRRWYARYGLIFVGGVLVVGVAWLLHRTQGTAIYEMYYWVSRPFVPEPPAIGQQQLTNVRILELEHRLAELERQNQQLKQLLGYVKTQPQEAITASIIGRSASEWWKQAILNRGSQNSIKVGDVITSTGGLVGRVVHVTPHTSRVLLISDPASRVGATVSRSRSMGLIEGKSSQIAVMRFFEKVPDVRAGDTVTTSPVSRLFPTGLPIGRVQSVNLESWPAPEATIQLSAPLNSLEWAIVQPYQWEGTSGQERQEN